MKYYIVTTFASTYGSCNYGTDSFDNSSANCVSGSGTGGSSSGGGSAGGGSTGGLSNTGFDIVLAATLACIIVFTSLVVRFVRRPSEPQETNQ
jgi:hypothetical protein